MSASTIKGKSQMSIFTIKREYRDGYGKDVWEMGGL